MSEVKLLISDKEYTIACAPGEEAHVAQLGRAIDAKVKSLGDGTGTSEFQKILFGALFLADELHELTKTASEDSARFAADKTAFEAEKRAANVAIGQRDAMATTITDLESELEGLQSAHQKHSTDVDNMRTELQQRRAEVEEIQKVKEVAESQIAELKRDRDNLASQISNKDTLLENANRLINETNLELSAAKTLAPAASTPQTRDAELAPALEQFAELLETCADKLEAQASST